LLQACSDGGYFLRLCIREDHSVRAYKLKKDAIAPSQFFPDRRMLRCQVGTNQLIASM
jgi:hypothetical protein